jgi:hypothetical protein
MACYGDKKWFGMMFHKLLFSGDLLKATLHSHFSDLHLTKLNVIIYFTWHKQFHELRAWRLPVFPITPCSMIIFTDVSEVTLGLLLSQITKHTEIGYAITKVCSHNLESNCRH